MEITEIKKMSEMEDTDWWFRGKRNLVKSCISKNAKLLDIGCGTGANLRAFSSNKSVGAEFSRDMIEIYTKTMDKPVVRCSAESLPFRKNSFDVVTILDVLEHLEKDTDAMKDIHHILKPSGNLIITVPAHMFLWHRHDTLLHHKRRYTMNELETKLKDAGLKIKKISYWNFLLFPAVMMFKLMNAGSDSKKINKYANALLYAIISADNILIKFFDLPLGISIFCIAEKC